MGAAAVHELLWSWRRAVQPTPDRTAPAAAAGGRHNDVGSPAHRNPIDTLAPKNSGNATG
jgi:hypothetical protein